MPSKFIPAIKGLNPLLDVKQSAEPFVVSGKNFVVDAQGPVSTFGNDVISFKAIADPTNVDIFEVSETLESFICTNVGIFRLDTYSRKLVLLYKYAVVVSSQFPWSIAAVGNRYYFARKDFGLLEYDIVLDEWTKLSGGVIPNNIYACEESEGRLIVLTDLWIAWTAIGDGRDFAASASTGAGAQALTKSGLSYPVPLGLKKTPEGFLTFLSTGIIRSQAIQAVAPFRHTVLSRQHAPINPYCLARTVSQSIVILTKAGLFETSGDLPKVWQPLMSEYLHLNVLKSIDYVGNQNNPRIYFDFNNTWFAVAVTTAQAAYLYTKAYILNIPIGEWGSFDESFVTLGKFKLLTDIVVGYQYGWIDTEGSIRIFNAAPGVETLLDLNPEQFYYRPWISYESVMNDGILCCRTNGNFNTVPTTNLTLPSVYNLYGKLNSYLDPVDVVAVEIPSVLSSGVYEFRCKSVFSFGIIETGLRQESKVYLPLNSAVTVGPLKLTDEQSIGRYMHLSNLAIGMNEIAAGSTADDWNSSLLYPTDEIVDWSLLTGEEDWGFGAIAGTDYSITLTPTLDGYTAIDDFSSTVELFKTAGKNKFYSCNTSGIYHLISITAENDNQNYHLKTLDVGYTAGGII